jgi:hypothetical protein
MTYYQVIVGVGLAARTHQKWVLAPIGLSLQLRSIANLNSSLTMLGQPDDRLERPFLDTDLVRDVLLYLFGIESSNGGGDQSRIR